MRNIFKFPDGAELDFTYPTDRFIEVGETFALHYKNEKRYATINRIETHKDQHKIYYYLEFKSTPIGSLSN